MLRVHQRPPIRRNKKRSVRYPPVKITGIDKKNGGGDAKRVRPQVTSNCEGPLSVTSGIALCAEKPFGKGLITIVMWIPSDTNDRVLARAHTYTRARARALAFTHMRAWYTGTYGHAAVVWTPVARRVSTSIIALCTRRRCKGSIIHWYRCASHVEGGLYKWWRSDNAVTLMARILLRTAIVLAQIESTMRGLIIDGPRVAQTQRMERRYLTRLIDTASTRQHRRSQKLEKLMVLGFTI